MAKAKADEAKASDATPETYIVGTRSLTTKRGILSPGAKIEAKDVMNDGTFERCIESGVIVKDES